MGFLIKLRKSNKMIKIAIVEDDINEQEKIQGFLKKLEEELNQKIFIKVFSNGEKFLFDFSYGLYDLVLMDIELSSTINGVETSKELRKIDNDVSLIFITSLVQYAIEGYKVNAIDYIVKPVDYDNFNKHVGHVIENLGNRNSDKIIITSDGSKIVQLIKDIYYVEVINHQLVFHTSKGEIKSYGSLKDIKEILLTHGFSLCNSCFLVNLDYVEKIEGYNVFVKGDELLISHPKRKTFLKELNLHLGK